MKRLTKTINGNHHPYLAQEPLHRYEVRWVAWESSQTPDGDSVTELKAHSKIFDTYDEAFDERLSITETHDNLYLIDIFDRFYGVDANGGLIELSLEQFSTAVTDEISYSSGKEDAEEESKPYLLAYGNGICSVVRTLYATAEERDAMVAELAAEEDCTKVTIYDYPDPAISKPSPAPEALSWNAEARSWAIQKGLFSGDGNGNYDWLGNVTREQLAVLLYKYSQLK